MTTISDIQAAGSQREPVVIVGAGQSGARCAEALRATGSRRPILLIGDEAHPPYERPSLSKETLFGTGPAENIAWVQSAERFMQIEIELRLGTAVAHIDRKARRLALADGSSLDYGTLVLTTGARPRRLMMPASDSPRVHVLRTLDDSRRLRAALRQASRLLVVGGGLIGLEVAAGAREAGLDVTIIQSSDRLMGRVVPEILSEHYATLHRARGVQIAFEAHITRLDADHEVRIECADGRHFTGDLVVLAIGVEPNIALAEEAGLTIERGVKVDQFGRSSDEHIFAAGDVAYHFNPLLQQHLQLESWQNAQNQAIAVARVIAGGAQPYAEIPWFWSDQYGVNLQVTGLLRADAPSLLRGRLGERGSMVLQTVQGRISCACGMDAPRELRAAKELIAAGMPIDAGVLNDPQIKLTDLVRLSKQKRISA